MIFEVENYLGVLTHSGNGRTFSAVVIYITKCPKRRPESPNAEASLGGSEREITQ